MNFGEWMAVDIPPEKLFKLEAECRALERSTNTSQLAAQLLRQCCYQQQVLQQAVHEIARLELELMQR